MKKVRALKRAATKMSLLIKYRAQRRERLNLSKAKRLSRNMHKKLILKLLKENSGLSSVQERLPGIWLRLKPGLKYSLSSKEVIIVMSMLARDFQKISMLMLCTEKLFWIIAKKKLFTTFIKSMKHGRDQSKDSILWTLSTISWENFKVLITVVLLSISCS